MTELSKKASPKRQIYINEKQAEQILKTLREANNVQVGLKRK
jgi:hypothetical protein